MNCFSSKCSHSFIFDQFWLEWIFYVFMSRKIETRNARQWRHSTAIASCHYFFGGKYDLIQQHRQSIHRDARNCFFTPKIPSPPVLRRQWKWHDILLFQLFGPVLFSAHVYGCSQLAGTSLADLCQLMPRHQMVQA